MWSIAPAYSKRYAGVQDWHGGAGGVSPGRGTHGIHSGLSRAPGGSGASFDDYREPRDAHDDHHHKPHAMPKADAWREKNRLAQKAFRQRQKVLPLPSCSNSATDAHLRQ